jgi:ribosomal protein L18
VAAHIDTNNTWTSYTGARSFATVPPTAVGNTGVYGIVYDTSNNQPISGAVVTLLNDTWSGTTTTNENGHYEFTVPYGSGTYYVSATATDFAAPSQSPITTNYDYVEKNIDMTKSQTYFSPHYVKLIVTDKYLSARYNATLIIYEGASTSPIFSDVAGDDGSVTIKMTEDSKYTIQTTYNAATQTDIMYPYDSMYFIVLDDNIVDVLPEQFYSYTDINVNKTEVNSTNAYVNVTYSDLLVNQTNSITIDIGNYDKNNTFVSVATNQTFNKTTIVNGNGNVTAAFLLTNYIGESYVVRLTIDHTIFGDVSKYYAVSFKGSNLPFDGKILAYFCIFLLFIVAMQFGRAEHATGAILLCGIFWLLYGLGVFDSLGNSLTTAMAAGGTLAAIYALAVYFNEKRREDGI